MKISRLSPFGHIMLQPGARSGQMLLLAETLHWDSIQELRWWLEFLLLLGIEGFLASPSWCVTVIIIFFVPNLMLAEGLFMVSWMVKFYTCAFELSVVCISLFII